MGNERQKVTYNNMDCRNINYIFLVYCVLSIYVHNGLSVRDMVA